MSMMLANWPAKWLGLPVMPIAPAEVLVITGFVKEADFVYQGYRTRRCVYRQCDLQKHGLGS